jgi:hypothetical protein
MRRLILTCALAVPAFPTEIMGYISDAPCGWNNARPGKEAKECARKCVRAGWDPVFVPDGQMNAYKISDKAMVLPHVGDHVAVVGELKNDTLILKKIRPAPVAAPQKKAR